MKYSKRIILFSLFAMNLVDQPAPEVTIEQGILSGKISSDGSFFEYLGIPYATVNSSTKFKAPLPPPSWKGTYKAVDDIYSCLQPTPIGMIGSEDCLKINVYVPANAKRKLAVMVYIHGGAFIIGSGGKLLYAPDFLVKHDVILVTFNYRLGPLGFLCLGIKEAPGNAGLKDQVAALRWVKKNIAAFRGDPDNVTIFGQSAGATSASILMASDVTKGLFNRVIVQSGASSSNWAINRQPLWVARLVAKELGYSVQTPKEIYELFSKLAYKDLITAKPKKPLGMYFDTQLLYYPCIENKIEGEEAILTDYPYNIFKSKPRNISMIHGTTSNEGLFLLANDSEEDLIERDAKYIFASDLQFPSEEVAKNISKKLKHFYFGEEKISFKVHKNVSKLNTHLYFEIPAILESAAVVRASNAPVYNYYFNYSGGRNLLKYMSGYSDHPGSSHGDDLLYLFKARVWQFPINQNDQKMIDLMTKLWTNYAKHGNPTPPHDNSVAKWIPSNKDNMNFLYISENLKMGPIPNLEVYEMWKNVYNKYRKINIPNDFKS